MRSLIRTTALAALLATAAGMALAHNCPNG